MILNLRGFTFLRSRRDFLKSMAATGTALYLGSAGLLSKAFANPASAAAEFQYKLRTVSLEHVAELREWFDKLNTAGRLSTNKTYRKYIGSFEFKAPKALPNARSIVILSMPLRIAAVTFHVKGKAWDVLIPAGYVDDGVRMAAVKTRIAKEVLRDASAKLEPVRLPLKTLAVRSGLAEYGRNNITFVEGYGSFHQLIGLCTDKVLEDHWRPLKLMRYCKGCSKCVKACPTNCYSDENFVIDIGKCVTLYNELPEPLPGWLPARAHQTLVGCLRCQIDCPPNQDPINNIEKLGDITEEETSMILSDRVDKVLQQSIAAKLKRFPVVEADFGYFRRNTKLALANVLHV